MCAQKLVLSLSLLACVFLGHHLQGQLYIAFPSSGKIISLMKGDMGMTRSMKKEGTRGHYTAKTLPIFLFHRKNISDKDIGMVSCSFVYLCCVMTPCSFIFRGSSHLHHLHFIFPLVQIPCA